MSDGLTLFESLYRRFMAMGGFSQPAVREDLEREMRDPQAKRHVPTPCPHGKTLLTCGECYINGTDKREGGWGWRR